MTEYLLKVLTQIRDFLKDLSPGKKMAMAAISFFIISAMIIIFLWAGNTTYVQLMNNLNPEDSTNIIRILREKHIPFKLDNTGKAISIPEEYLYDFRLEIATMGLPQSSVVGYELFDKQQLGTTSFVQKVNQKRAQEGELMRTINSIKGVKRSRVHLALPQKSTFIEDQKKPSASVVLELEPSTMLSDKQVFGIGNLVARAVEGLDINDVMIMNADGKVLSRNQSDPFAAATASQLDYKEKVQTDLEKRIENMLIHIVGDGKVVAKVTADLDFSQVNETQTVYDSDGSAVRSVEKHNDTMNGTRPGPYGVSGAASNTPGQTPSANGEVKTETSKNNEVTNYEVPQTTRKTMHAMGAIKKLSVAVVVDGKTIKSQGKDGKIISKVESWSPEKLKEFQEIASSAIGLDLKRGDVIEVKNIEFTREDFEEAQKVIAAREQSSYVQNLVIYGVIGLVILLFFVIVVRPFIKWITENTIDSVDTFLPQTIEELERLQKNTNLPNLDEAIPVLPESLDPAKVEGEMVKEKITTLVEANPHKAALILKDWLHGEVKKKDATDELVGKGKAASA